MATAKSQKPKPKATKPESASKLFTIGYEKSKPDALMAELKRAKRLGAIWRPTQKLWDLRWLDAKRLGIADRVASDT